jgi:methylphosphotriester-DNA--protein-cysteine methyltransferase
VTLVGMTVYVLTNGNYTRVFHGPRCRVVVREHPGQFQTTTRASALLQGLRPCRICGGH